MSFLDVWHFFSCPATSYLVTKHHSSIHAHLNTFVIFLPILHQITVEYSEPGLAGGVSLAFLVSLHHTKISTVSTFSFNFSFYTHARVTRTRRSTSNLAVALKRLYLQKPLHKSWIAEKRSLAIYLHNANVNFALLNCSLQRADHDYQRLHCFVELFLSDRTRSDDCDQDVFLTRQWQAFFETYVA